MKELMRQVEFWKAGGTAGTGAAVLAVVTLSNFEIVLKIAIELVTLAIMSVQLRIAISKLGKLNKGKIDED